MDLGDDPVKRVTLAIEGRPALVDTLVTLLRYIESCGRHGSTGQVELYIDGDGAAQISVTIDGERRPLGRALEDFLFCGGGERPAELEGHEVYPFEAPEGPRLRVDLV